MNRRSLTIIAATVGALLLLAGCEPAATGGHPSARSIQSQQQALTSQAFSQQQAAVPYPAGQLTDSLERRNIRERLLRTNQPNRIQYVYILSLTGNYLGYYVIKGKVSSTQSQMTASQSIIGHSQYDSTDGAVIEAPGDDGSYGANEDGVFFFLADGTMVETSMPYMVSDQPLAVAAPKLSAK